MSANPQWPARLLDLRRSATLPAFPAGRGVLVLADGHRLQDLRRLREKGHALEVFAVVPNMTLYVRQVSQLGAPLAGLKLARDAGIAALVRTGVFALSEIPRVLRNDFLAVMRLLITFELNQLRPLKPTAVFLHPQITDLGLAFRNRSLLTDFQARVGTLANAAQAGFGTNNLTLFLDRMSAWKLPLPPVLAPFNPQGFLMKENVAQCELFAGRKDVTVVADHACVVPGAEAETSQYVKRFAGIQSVIVDRPEALGA